MCLHPTCPIDQETTHYRQALHTPCPHNVVTFDSMAAGQYVWESEVAHDFTLCMQGSSSGTAIMTESLNFLQTMWPGLSQSAAEHTSFAQGECNDTNKSKHDTHC